MKYHLQSYHNFRRRIVKEFLKFNGWHFRGQDSTCQWPIILFISPAKGNLSKMQFILMRYLTSRHSKWAELSNLEIINQLLLKKQTILIRWDKTQSRNLLTALLKSARKEGAMISACAWLSKRKVIKFHSQFRPSYYTDRDIRYIDRFFKFYKQI
jgi:hypothetical protein